jgi:hypothetical protein
VCGGCTVLTFVDCVNTGSLVVVFHLWHWCMLMLAPFSAASCVLHVTGMLVPCLLLSSLVAEGFHVVGK